MYHGTKGKIRQVTKCKLIFVLNITLGYRIDKAKLKYSTIMLNIND